jgi:hypothetical protein
MINKSSTYEILIKKNEENDHLKYNLHNYLESQNFIIEKQFL